MRREPAASGVRWARCFGAVCLLALAALPSQGQMPPYQPGATLSQPQILHSWGEPQMGPLLLAWEKGFARYQPNVRFADTLKGTETAQAALFTHVAEFAAMGRPILPLERHVSSGGSTICRWR